MPKTLMMRSILVAIACSLTVSELLLADTPRLLNVPAGELAAALKELAAQANIELVFEPEQVKGIRTHGIQGTYSAQDAIGRLLEGTALEVYTDTSGAMVISLPVGPAAHTERSTGNLGKQLAQASHTPQNTASSSEAPSAGTGSTSASSKEDSTRDSVASLEEIVVTSERLGRSLMDTSTSVIVLDAKALEHRPNLEGANDLLGRIPNITSTGTTNLAPAVRGIDGTGPAQGADAFLAGTRPRLNLQLDGRPASYNEVIFGDAGIWDVEQIEVLRGPQSALQGRNAIAGTLAIKTKDPTYDYRARLRVVGGNMQNRQYSGALSGPIIDEQLAFRVAADRQQSESFVRMTPFEGVPNPRQLESTTLRGKLLIEPKAFGSFRSLLTLTHAEVTAPQSETIHVPFENETNPLDAPVFVPRTTGAILASTVELSDQLAFQSTIAYTDVNVERKTLPGAGNAEINARELVVEPSIHFGTRGSRVSGLAGLYYFRAEQDEFIDLFGGGTFNDSTRTTAAFGEATVALSETFDITVGARYEEERRERAGSVFIFVIDLDETYEAFLPKLVLSWHPNEQLTLGMLAARGYNGGSAGFTYSPPFAAYTFEPEYVLNYEAFARASLAGGRLALTANLFFSDYDDMQLPFSLGPESTVIRNADKAQTFGVELGLRLLATERLELFGEVGVLETKVTEYPGSGIEGNELPRAPAVTADFGATYKLGGFDVSVDGRYSDAYYSEVLNDPRGKTEPYWLANAQASYRFSKLRVFGFVSNMFDADDPVLLFPPTEFTPLSGNIQRPRTYGVGVQVDF